MKKTKEEILQPAMLYYYMPKKSLEENQTGKCDCKKALKAMEEYKDQELAELQAKYDKLKEAFDSAIIEIGSLNPKVGTVSKWYKIAGLTDEV